MIPVDLAFKPEFQSTTFYQIFDLIVDALFLFDMAFMFIHSFQNQKGKEVFDSLQIAKKYCLSMRFVGDALAILGTNVVTNFMPSFKIFGIFKMGRILRLGVIISRLNVAENVKAMLKFFKLFFYLCLYMHILGCSWWMVTVQNKDKVDENGMSLQWY